MKDSKIPVAEVAEEKVCVVNCPKCGTSLKVKVGNYAYVCPVCSQIFRTRAGEKLVKDVSRKTMVEAYVSVDKDAEGEVKADSVVTEVEE
jgi:tRNA(Ile2) C34 agmatinyltransferase TiaS